MGEKPSAFPRPVELALYAIAPLATLATAPILAQTLGPVGRGQYGVAMAVAAFAIALGSWGQGETYLARAREGHRRYSDHARIALTSGLVAGVVTCAALILLGLPVLLAIVTALWVPLLSQVSLWRSVSIAAHQLRAPALDSALGPFLRLVTLILLAAFALLTAETAVFAVQAALALGSLVTVWIVSRRLRIAETGLPSQPDGVSRGASIVIFNGLHAIILRADLVILQLLSTPFQVGVYSAPASLTTSALALSAAYRPRVQSAALSPQPLRRIAREVLHVLILGTVASIALWVAVPTVIPFLFGEAFDDSEPLARLLVVAIVPLLMLDLAFSVLVVLGRRRDLLGTAGFAALVNTVALIAATPTLGATGAAIACILGNCAGAVAGWTLLVRALRENTVAPPD